MREVLVNAHRHWDRISVLDSSCPPAPGAEGEQDPRTLRRYAEQFANSTTVTPGSVRLPLKLGYLPAGLGLVLAGIEPHGRGADRLDKVELELLDPSGPEPVNSRLTIRLEPRLGSPTIRAPNG